MRKFAFFGHRPADNLKTIRLAGLRRFRATTTHEVDRSTTTCDQRIVFSAFFNIDRTLYSIGFIITYIIKYISSRVYNYI
jgi:hypothetical protein